MCVRYLDKSVFNMKCEITTIHRSLAHIYNDKRTVNAMPT